MNFNAFQDNMSFIEESALENYQQRNGVVDYRLPGECILYVPTWDFNYQPSEEIALQVKVSKTVKGDMRYTYQLNGKRIPRKEICAEFNRLGAFML